MVVNRALLKLLAPLNQRYRLLCDTYCLTFGDEHSQAIGNDDAPLSLSQRAPTSTCNVLRVGLVGMRGGEVIE